MRLNLKSSMNWWLYDSKSMGLTIFFNPIVLIDLPV